MRDHEGTVLPHRFSYRIEGNTEAIHNVERIEPYPPHPCPACDGNSVVHNHDQVGDDADIGMAAALGMIGCIVAILACIATLIVWALT